MRLAQLISTRGLASLALGAVCAAALCAGAQASGAPLMTGSDDGWVKGACERVNTQLAPGAVIDASFPSARDLQNNPIDAFDTRITPPAAVQGKFIAANMPTGFVPFGVAALSSDLYVTYMMRDIALHEEVAAGRLGHLGKFGFNGNSIGRAAPGARDASRGTGFAPAAYACCEADLPLGRCDTSSADEASGAAPAAHDAAARAIPGVWSVVLGTGHLAKPVATFIYSAGFANSTDRVLDGIATVTSTTSGANPF